MSSTSIYFCSFFRGTNKTAGSMSFSNISIESRTIQVTMAQAATPVDIPQ
jgi:hypothetical protein